MMPHLEPAPICRLGKWNSLLVLTLVSGALFQQTVAARAQSAAAKPAPDVIVFTNGDQLTGTLERATGDSFVFIPSSRARSLTVTMQSRWLTPSQALPRSYRSRISPI